MKKIISLCLFFCTAPLAAQSSASSAPGAVGATNLVWAQVADYILKSAEQMPEADYSFRPTPEVRTFGQLIGHVAGAQYVFCSAATGDKPMDEGDIEKSKTSKADLIAAMKASIDYCKRAYAQSDASAQGMTKLFGADRTRLFALINNASHDSEHYGNIVTYLRMKGMVPPSSQPAPTR